MPIPTAVQKDIVLLHGINNSPSSWNGVIKALPQERAITPLLPPIANIDTIAKQLLKQLPERFVLVGHSFGGYVSLAMLEQAPERIEALILVNSLDNADTPQAASGRREKAAQARAGNYPALAAGATAASYHPDNLGDEAIMASREQAIAEYGPERFAAHQEASAIRPDRSAILAATSIPTLVLASEDDRVILTEKQQVMAERAGTAWQTIGGAGHMLPAEQPSLVAEVISSWLGTLSA